VRCLSTVHVYAQDVPQFLHDCPRRFIDHCIRRLPPSVDIIKRTQITALSGDTFDIQSKEQVYRIDLYGSIPTCQCIDFSRWFMPCKHMLAVVQHFGWQCLPQQYRNFPIFVLDSDVADVPAFSGTDRHYTAAEPITDQLPNDSVSLAAGEQTDDSAVPVDISKEQRRVRQCLAVLSSYTYSLQEPTFLHQQLQHLIRATKQQLSGPWCSFPQRHKVTNAATVKRTSLEAIFSASCTASGQNGA